jgi:ferredoxin-NADP reductase
MAIPGASNDSPVTDGPALLPAIQWQTATVIEIVTRTPRIKSFFFTLSCPFAFQAGQHVDVRLTAPDGYRAMRSYSIASAPEDASPLELAIEYLESGEVSQFFHEVVAVGDAIELRGPLGGYFIWKASDGGTLLLVGGGSGVVPLMSMVRHRRLIASTTPVVLLFSARTLNEALYVDELIELDERHDGFTLILTLTRDQPVRPGDYNRRIDAGMMAEVLARFPRRPAQVFVCGSNAFVDAAADGAVAAGVPARIVRTERYGV